MIEACPRCGADKLIMSTKCDAARDIGPTSSSDRA
jgi:hypothetical protein